MSDIEQHTCCGIRLVVNTSLFIKHTFFPRGEESSISLSERAKAQLDQRANSMLNDLTLPLKLVT